ncbi:TatD family hydrolase [Coralloluteibacterium thermophilus]|uniref:TatD family hydrolase n=1 Tax=Coralloluteibacterium thermophilum TaxID=2707049 RepID=A0ABV9NGP6_9GAMM
MPPDLIDTHSHLDVDAFDADRDAVLAAARAAGVRRHVVCATHAAAWPRLRAVCDRHPGLYPAYGLHPMYLEHHRPEHLDALADRLARERPVALGECGLDHYVETLDRDAQLRCFDAQLELARANDLPVVVHARRAVESVIQRIRRIGGLRGVVHSYAGSPEQARQLFDLGFLIGIGGPVTYPRAQRLRRLVADMPLDFLLLETDAPDQPDADWRGRRNVPARLETVLHCVAALRREAPEAVAAATTANAVRLFALPPAPA